MSTSPAPGEGIFRFAASSPRRGAAKTIASKKSLSDGRTMHKPLWYNPAYRRRREASTVDIKGAAHLIDKNHLRSVKIGGGDLDGVFPWQAGERGALPVRGGRRRISAVRRYFWLGYSG